MHDEAPTSAPPGVVRTTRGLGLLLPIAPGDRVAVIGRDQAPLARSLANTGATPWLFVEHADGRPEGATDGFAVEVVGPAKRVPAAAASSDHVILVDARGTWRTSAVGELARVCRPGGHVALAVPHRSRVRRRAGWSRRELARQVAAHGFEVTAVFGIRPSIEDVRDVVPLGGHAAAWYVRNASLATSVRGALLQRMFGLAGRRTVAPLFPALVVTAQRHEAC